jgi:UDP-N-acetylmuramyl pentapeptide synthase
MNFMSYQDAHTLGLNIELLAILHLPRIVYCGGMVELGGKESSAECHGELRRLANHIFTLEGF